MNIPGAVVVAGGLIAGAVVVSGYGQAQSRAPEAPKAAGSTPQAGSPAPQAVGRVLLSASGQDVWRIDTATGDVHFCVYKNNRVVCDR